MLAWETSILASGPSTMQHNAQSASATSLVLPFCIHPIINSTQQKINDYAKKLTDITHQQKFVQEIATIDAESRQYDAYIDHYKEQLKQSKSSDPQHMIDKLNELETKRDEVSSRKKIFFEQPCLSKEQLELLMVFYKWRYEIAYNVAANSLVQVKASHARATLATANNKELVAEHIRLKNENVRLKQQLAQKQPLQADFIPHLTSPTGSIGNKRKNVPSTEHVERQKQLRTEATEKRLNSGNLSTNQEQQDTSSN